MWNETICEEQTRETKVDEGEELGLDLVALLYDIVVFLEEAGRTQKIPSLEVDSISLHYYDPSITYIQSDRHLGLPG